MPETNNVEVACIQAALSCATCGVDDPDSQNIGGIDETTRDAAREYLRRQWQYDANEEQPGDNPGGND